MIVVTGANGKLGRLVMQGLLTRMPAAEIVAAVRNPASVQDLAAQGVQVRYADYGKPESLATAFAGAEKILLISGTDLGNRLAHHAAVIEAARQAGVTMLAYTSLLRADTSSLLLARTHLQTEDNVRASGLQFCMLRNGWYMENHTASLPLSIEHGAILGTAGEGRFASAARADYAAAAVAVLTQPGHENKVYELAGDQPYTYTELAAETAAQSGKPVVYNNLPPDAYAAALRGFHLPEEIVGVIVDGDLGAAKGELDSRSQDLRTLLGHPTTSLKQAVADALKA